MRAGVLFTRMAVPVITVSIHWGELENACCVMFSRAPTLHSALVSATTFLTAQAPDELDPRMPANRLDTLPHCSYRARAACLIPTALLACDRQVGESQLRCGLLDCEQAFRVISLMKTLDRYSQWRRQSREANGEGPHCVPMSNATAHRLPLIGAADRLPAYLLSGAYGTDTDLYAQHASHGWWATFLSPHLTIKRH